MDFFWNTINPLILAIFVIVDTIQIIRLRKRLGEAEQRLFDETVARMNGEDDKDS